MPTLRPAAPHLCSWKKPQLNSLAHPGVASLLCFCHWVNRWPVHMAPGKATLMSFGSYSELLIPPSLPPERSEYILVPSLVHFVIGSSSHSSDQQTPVLNVLQTDDGDKQDAKPTANNADICSQLGPKRMIHIILRLQTNCKNGRKL